MSIETGVASSMNSIIIALCMLFVIGVGVVDARRMKKIVEQDNEDEEKKDTPQEKEEA